MICEERFYRRGDDWHTVQCESPAKWKVTPQWPSSEKPRRVCGRHVRRYQRQPTYFRVEEAA